MEPCRRVSSNIVLVLEQTEKRIYSLPNPSLQIQLFGFSCGYEGARPVRNGPAALNQPPSYEALGQKKPRTNFLLRAFRRLCCRYFLWISQIALLQDREIWENKIMHTTRNTVKKDYAWAKYDKWIAQFYSENSMGYDKKGVADW